MSDSATYSLSVIIKHISQLPRGLTKDISALRGFKKEAEGALKIYSALRKEMGRSISVSNLSKFDAKLKTLKADTRSLSSDVNKLQANLSKSVSTPGLDKALQATRVLQRASRDVRPPAAGLPARRLD